MKPDAGCLLGGLVGGIVGGVAGMLAWGLAFYRVVMWPERIPIQYIGNLDQGSVPTVAFGLGAIVGALVAGLWVRHWLARRAATRTPPDQ